MTYRSSEQAWFLQDKLVFPGCQCYPVVYTGFWAWGGGHGSNGPVWGGVLFSLEKAKISRFFKLEIFQKILKKQ